MGLRRLRALTPADLAGLEKCPDCGVHGCLDPDARWARAAMDRWGLVGVSDAPGAFALVCPLDALPADHPLAGASDTPSTAVLLALRVASELRRHGAGRHLVQSLSARMVNQVERIDAAGGRAGENCLTPDAEWLMRKGFQPCERVDWLPGGAQRLRLDLRRTVSWQPQLDEVVNRLVRWAPASETGPAVPRATCPSRRRPGA